ncbi:hypothetical protein L211DRAFT_893418 [Terfezia boudieri ATCC MYA-4762]|uniref:Uncharacterized protein n=1 Tax=Terfezia boudieri ATCC MYA-4762 TaxID=1051890 RepID=A0A3N4LC65_9PEZI|nr:hypothetical protein L211DRAFT_893418 [Terfezia boudieri ATCC MYA-4762]
MAPLPRRFTRNLLKYAPASTPPLGNPPPLDALPVLPLNSAFGGITSNATFSPSHLTPAPTSPSTLNSINFFDDLGFFLAVFLLFCICGRCSQYIWHAVNGGKDNEIEMDDHHHEAQRRVSLAPVCPVVRLPLKTHKSPDRGLGSEKKKDESCPSHTPFSLPPRHLPPNPGPVDDSPQIDTTPLVSHRRGGPLGATYPYGAITKSCHQISLLNSSTPFACQSWSQISAASSSSASPLGLTASRSAPEGGGTAAVGGGLLQSSQLVHDHDLSSTSTRLECDTYSHQESDIHPKATLSLKGIIRSQPSYIPIAMPS